MPRPDKLSRKRLSIFVFNFRAESLRSSDCGDLFRRGRHDKFPNGIDHQLGLIEMNPMRALRSNQLPYVVADPPQAIL